MIRILVVDDHEIVREGLHRALAHDTSFTVVGEASSRHEAIAQIASLNPDIVVVDIHLPDGNGIDVVRWARKNSRKIGLVVLTVSHMPEQIKAAMQAGASGYVEKSAPINELVSAIKHAAHSPLAFSTHRTRSRTQEKKLRPRYRLACAWFLSQRLKPRRLASCTTTVSPTIGALRR